MLLQRPCLRRMLPLFCIDMAMALFSAAQCNARVDTKAVKTRGVFEGKPVLLPSLSCSGLCCAGEDLCSRAG